jgi:enoyl-CoA hydratase
MALVETTRIGGALQLTIARPEKRNALNFAAIRELGAQLDVARGDTSLRFLVLTAAGDKAFCAGGDLQEYAGIRSREATLAMADEYRQTLDALRRFPVPVIAALNGDALGGGAELALACDLRVAAAHARIGFLQGSLGITTAWGGGVDLLNAVGRSRALQLLASAEILDAPAALRIGLFHAVAETGETWSACVARFCAPFQQRKPRVMRGFKALAVAHAAGMERAGLTALETEHLIDTWTDEDHWQAVEASRGRAGKRQVP